MITYPAHNDTRASAGAVLTTNVDAFPSTLLAISDI